VAGFSLDKVTKRSGGKKAGDKTEVPIAGLRDLKACRRLRAVILGLEERLDGDAKRAMKEYFVPAGCETKVKPDNFTGVDDGQTGSCQYRARNFGVYGMNDDTAEQITEIGLGALVQTRTVYEIESWVFDDPKVKKAIEQALSRVENAQEAVEMRAKRTLVPGAIEWLFANKGDEPEFVEAALDLLSTPSISIRYDKTDDNIGPDADRVAKLLSNPEFATIVTDAAADPGKRLNPTPAEKKSPKRKAA